MPFVYVSASVRRRDVAPLLLTNCGLLAQTAITDSRTPQGLVTGGLAHALVDAADSQERLVVAECAVPARLGRDLTAPL